MEINMNYCSKCGTKLRVRNIPDSEESVYYCKKCKMFLLTRFPDKKEIKLELSEITRLKIMVRHQYSRGIISKFEYNVSRNIINKMIRFVKLNKGERMKYIIKMTLDGAFPGSPDHDYFKVDEETWDKIRDLVYPKFMRCDTLEDANSQLNEQEKKDE